MIEKRKASWNPLRWAWPLPVALCVVGATNTLNAVFVGEVFATGRGMKPHMLKYADDPKLFIWMLLIWVLTFLMGVALLKMTLFPPRKGSGLA
jgi:hypothetical protein